MTLPTPYVQRDNNRVPLINGGLLNAVEYDTATLTIVGAVQTYVFTSRGITVATVTLTYTDSTFATLSTAVRT